MKHCNYCKLDKDIENFSWKNKQNNIRHNKCKECHSKYLIKHYELNPKIYLDSNKKIRNNIKECVDNLKNNPCMDCGAKYPPYVMDFDHRNSQEKSFNISRGLSKGSLSLILNEIEKCDIVCSNCHRERTHKRLMGV